MGVAPFMISISRRSLVRAVCWGGTLLVGERLASRPAHGASEEGQPGEDEFIKQIIGKAAAESPQVRLEMPRVFRNGNGVPLTLTIDSPMTEADHVLQVHVLAPKNPLPIIAVFHFTPQSGRAVVATRVRLAGPQNVLAVAQMSDGARLMSRTFVEVMENGCPTGSE
jgi:sulfur-oxidizing protein SoxY